MTYTARPTSAQTVRYEPAKRDTSRTRPSPRRRRTTAGIAPGNIIAAIIEIHTPRKNANEPSSVETPMSIAFISRTAANHDAPASATVAVTATTVAPGLVTEASVWVLIFAVDRRVVGRRVRRPFAQEAEERRHER